MSFLEWPEVYRKLGIKPVINAQSWVTVLGGSIMRKEVLEAMNDASKVFVDMIELNKSAGKVIAKICNSEAGLVTNGCASAQVLMSAACMTGEDDYNVEKLPNTEGMKNEVIIFKGQRNRYDKAFETSGAIIKEFGTEEDATEEDLISVISNKTCAIAYVIMPFYKPGIGLKKTIEIAHKNSIPVILDAAAEIPPRSNLHRFINMGVDMVAFSGGKGIGGPQSSGILAGREDLINSAFKNSLNLHSNIACVGRPMKVSKENIIGLVTALELYLDSNEEEEYDSWKEKSEYIKNQLKDIPNLDVKIENTPTDRQGTQPILYFHKDWKGKSPEKIKEEMINGDPPIYLGVGGSNLHEYIGEINIVMTNVMEGEEIIIADRLNKLLRE
jgi:L-seryl-tRNA(Ser) seleniumtransferase